MHFSFEFVWISNSLIIQQLKAELKDDNSSYLRHATYFQPGMNLTSNKKSCPNRINADFFNLKEDNLAIPTLLNLAW